MKMNVLLQLAAIWVNINKMIENLPVMWETSSGRYPGERNGNPLQYFCLENPMDRGIWWATVHGGAKNWR